MGIKYKGMIVDNSHIMYEGDTSNFTAVCGLCSHHSTIDNFIHIDENSTCGTFIWFNCPTCGYEEEL